MKTLTMLLLAWGGHGAALAQGVPVTVSGNPLFSIAHRGAADELAAPARVRWTIAEPATATWAAGERPPRQHREVPGAARDSPTKAWIAAAARHDLAATGKKNISQLANKLPQPSKIALF